MALGVGNLNVVRQVGRLMDDDFCSCPFELMYDVDLILLNVGAGIILFWTSIASSLPSLVWWVNLYTHSVSHAHFLCTFSLREVQTRTRMAQGVCSVFVISLHFALSILMFHPPSLLFPQLSL